MPGVIPYKSFCWNLGTTSFRTKDFNKTIEEQLAILEKFWDLEENQGKNWNCNDALQISYYDFMKENGFVDGEANNKAKDAREKTSGLVDIGLIYSDRKLSGAGRALLDISKNNDFTSDNFLRIPKDSFIYLKQLLKTSNNINGETVRPFIVLIYLLTKLGTLKLEEYTYLLPLCTSAAYTEHILSQIKKLRNHEISVNEIIVSRLLEMDNYQAALSLLLKNQVDTDLLCEIGMNRKSRKYDKPYFNLYVSLRKVYLYKKMQALPEVFKAISKITIGKWWKKYIFKTNSEVAIKRNPVKCLNRTIFDGINNERELKIAFFKAMHLFKAKATLADYLDLNRRYTRTTDIILFDDNTVKLDIVPKYFFESAIEELYTEAYTSSDKLFEDCALEDISKGLSINEKAVINSINKEFNTNASTMEEASNTLENERYKRLQHLIDSKFGDDQLLELLKSFETRADNDIRSKVTDNADIPTIFEYILGIVWYKASGRKGKILEYMKLSLDADLLPKTHAAGGEADIVYEYAAEENIYPKHTLLLEATLSDATNQRRMEMEPVSRHLGQHLLLTKNLNSYCVFVTNKLNINVISDFRGRKAQLYYDTQDTTKFVDGMKIIPLEINELKKIIKNHLKYEEIYPIFEEAFRSEVLPHAWYKGCIQKYITDAVR